MKVDSVKLEKISNIIINNLKIELRKTLDVLDLQFEDFYYWISKLNDIEKNKVFSIAIDGLLEQLKSSITVQKYYEMQELIDRTIRYYVSNKENFAIVVEEGNAIASNLLVKTLSLKKRKLDYISCVKKFCLSRGMQKEKVYDVLMWIVIRYTATFQCLEWQKYLTESKI